MSDSERNGEIITANWKWDDLNNVCEIILGQSPPSSTYNKESVGLPFYQGKTEFGEIFPSPIKWCNKPQKIAQEGDVLLSVRAPVGPTNLCQEESCIGRGLAAIRPNEHILSKFVLYYFRNIEKELASKAIGTTFSAITGDTLRKQKIPLPPIEDQERIVSKIEELFTQLDTAETALKRAKINLKRYKQSVLQAAVTGELTREWREAHQDEIEPATKLLERIKAERRSKWDAEIRAKGKDPAREKYEEPSAPDVSELPELPEGWCWLYTELIIDYLQYGTSEKANLDSSGIPVLRMGNIQDGELDFGNLKYLPENTKNIEKYYLDPGDILFNRTNSAELVGKTAVFRNSHLKSTFASYLIRVRTNNNYSPVLLALYTNSIFGKKFISSVVSQQVGQANVNGEKLKKMPIPLLSFAEQQAIIEIINEKFYQIETIHKFLEKNINRINLSKRAILQKAFTGKLIQHQTEES